MKGGVDNKLQKKEEEEGGIGNKLHQNRQMLSMRNCTFTRRRIPTSIFIMAINMCCMKFQQEHHQHHVGQHQQEQPDDNLHKKEEEVGSKKTAKEGGP